MTSPKPISNCCNAPVRAEWGDDFAHESKLKELPRGVTVWHVCSACQKACDVHPNVMDIGKDTVQKIYDLLLERHPEIPCLTHFEEIVEQAISKAKKEALEEAIRVLEELHRNSETQSHECSQDGYEFGIEDSIDILKSLK